MIIIHILRIHTLEIIAASDSAKGTVDVVGDVTSIWEKLNGLSGGGGGAGGDAGNWFIRACKWSVALMVDLLGITCDGSGDGGSNAIILYVELIE